jgi:hypothetical protein
MAFNILRLDLKYILILSSNLHTDLLWVLLPSSSEQNCYMAGGRGNDRMALKERMLEEEDWIYLVRDGILCGFM